MINFFIVVGDRSLCALSCDISFQQIALLVLTAMLSAVPVALPATFTLAAALGARTLAQKGVLLTRLSSLNEAAMVDVLCCDKTGTLTRTNSSVERRAAGQERLRRKRCAALCRAGEFARRPGPDRCRHSRDARRKHKAPDGRR